MKMLLTLAAAALTTAALSMPASAEVSCDPSDDMTSVKATNCDLWSNENAFAAMPRAALAYAPRRAHSAQRAYASRRAYAANAYASEAYAPGYAFAPWFGYAPGYASGPGYANGPRSHNEY